MTVPSASILLRIRLIEVSISDKCPKKVTSNITVGDYTMYNDFVNAPVLFEKNNELSARSVFLGVKKSRFAAV